QAALVGLRSAAIRLAAAVSPAVLAASASALRRSVNSPGSAPYSSSAAAATRSPAAPALFATYRSCPGPQPREQIVLGQRRAGRVGHPDEVLVAEGLFDDLRRDLAEPGVAVDLRAVREQRRALALQYRADIDRGGDPSLRLQRPAAALGVIFPGRHLNTGRAQRLPYRPPGAAAHRGQVDLRRDPCRPRRGLRGTAGVHVVRVLVGALVVIGDEDLGAVLGDQAA